jgi:hypothetical protein
VAEGQWLERAAAATNATEFDEALPLFRARPVADERGPDSEEADLAALFRSSDVGVAGLLQVLAAAGYAPCNSCRGHPHDEYGRAPQVRIGTEPERLQVLVEFVRQTECGVETGDDGIVSVYARSVTELHRLAELMLDNRAVFEALPPPPWLARARVTLAHGENFEWDRSELD